MLKKKRKLGRHIDELTVGEKVNVSKKMEDKDILLYIGLSDDANPIYYQHDYASRTPFEKPIVPHNLINIFVHSAISIHLPGPGVTIKHQVFTYPHPLYHYGTLHLEVEIIQINKQDNTVKIKVTGRNELNHLVIEGEVVAHPPYPWKPITHDIDHFENF